MTDKKARTPPLRAAAFPLTENAVDVVVSFETIEHVERHEFEGLLRSHFRHVASWLSRAMDRFRLFRLVSSTEAA